MHTDLPPKNTNKKKETYGENYFMHGVGSCYKNYRFIPEIALQRAAAFTDAAGVQPDAKVLDYGCAMGVITAGLAMHGFTATVVDISEWAVRNCVPEAKGLVHALGKDGLKEFTNDSFDLVIAKDVFEHVPVSDLKPLVDELMRIAAKLIFLCPVVGPEGTYLRTTDEEDATHITRLTKEEWLALFPYKTTECAVAIPAIKGEHAYGSVCALLSR